MAGFWRNFQFLTLFDTFLLTSECVTFKDCQKRQKRSKTPSNSEYQETVSKRQKRQKQVRFQGLFWRFSRELSYCVTRGVSGCQKVSKWLKVTDIEGHIWRFWRFWRFYCFTGFTVLPVFACFSVFQCFPVFSTNYGLGLIAQRFGWETRLINTENRVNKHGSINTGNRVNKHGLKGVVKHGLKGVVKHGFKGCLEGFMGKVVF